MISTCGLPRSHAIKVSHYRVGRQIEDLTAFRIDQDATVAVSAAPSEERIFQFVEPFAGHFIPAVGEPAISLVPINRADGGCSAIR